MFQKLQPAQTAAVHLSCYMMVTRERLITFYQQVAVVVLHSLTFFYWLLLLMLKKYTAEFGSSNNVFICIVVVMLKDVEINHRLTEYIFVLLTSILTFCTYLVFNYLQR